MQWLSLIAAQWGVGLEYRTEGLADFMPFFPLHTVRCSGVLEGLVESFVLWKLNSNIVESLFVLYPGFCSFVCITLYTHFVLRGACFILGLTVERKWVICQRVLHLWSPREARGFHLCVHVCVRLSCSCCRALRDPWSSTGQPRLTAQGSRVLLHHFSFFLRPRFYSLPLSWSPSVSRFVFTRHCGWCWATISGVSLGPLVRNFSSFGV